MKTTALIMAGGRGERFWPRSRKNMPKQFLSLTEDGKTMIQLTVERILPLVDISDIFVVTNKDYKALVKKQLPILPEENILCEPIRRNTAPCIGLGAVHIAKKYGDVLMMVLPSDHLVKYNSMYLNALREACRIAEDGMKLVTIGITPNYPETGYGYIKFIPNQEKGQAYAVDCFVEKPTLEEAKGFIATEEYLWNSGMFVWKVSAILERFKELLPETYNGLLRIGESIGTVQYADILEKEFNNLKSESVDYAIMERTTGIYTVPGSFGWDDVGSWTAVERIRTSNEFGNIVRGNVITVESQNCIIEAGDKLIAMVGVEDLIVVDSKDATLICKKQFAGDIKKVLDKLKSCNRDEYI